MKIKTTALLMAFVLMLGLLTSCGKAADDDGGAPFGMKTISTELVDFNLHVPSTWLEDISTGVITARYSDTDASNISVMKIAMGINEATLDDFWAGHKAGFEATFTDLEMIEEGTDMLMGGQAAKRYIYTATMLDMKYRFMQIAAIKGGYVYLFTYTSTDDLYESHIDDVNSIVEHFSFK
ncbi:MAG: hypothetical protein IJA85_05045 [Clostridia bacterium]|nr:hypothetical protein [Clostridia bacterium]MBQ4574546.1 hypothetical protein [Clostridia bacterium]